MISLPYYKSRTYAIFCAWQIAAKDASTARTAQPDTMLKSRQLVDQLQNDDCLGLKACPTDLCKDVLTWRKTPEAKSDVKGALERLTAIRNSAAAAGNTPNLKMLVRVIDAWIDLIGRDAVTPSSSWAADNEKLFGGSGDEIDIGKDLSTRCTAGDCAKAFREAVEI